MDKFQEEILLALADGEYFNCSRLIGVRGEDRLDILYYNIANRKTESRIWNYWYIDGSHEFSESTNSNIRIYDEETAGEYADRVLDQEGAFEISRDSLEDVIDQFLEDTSDSELSFESE